MSRTLTAGQKGDAPQAAALIEGLPAEVVLADKRGRSPSSPTTRHVLSNIRSTSITMSLCPAPSRGTLLQQAQAVPPSRNPLRKDRPKLPCRRHSRSLAAVSVHTA